MSTAPTHLRTSRTSSREVQRAVIDVLKKFRNDGNITLRLSEVHARLGVSVPMRVLRSTLQEMQGDTFVLENYDPFIETNTNVTTDSAQDDVHDDNDIALGNDVIQLL